MVWMLLPGLTVAGGRDTSELITKKGLSKIDGSLGSSKTKFILKAETVRKCLHG